MLRFGNLSPTQMTLSWSSFAPDYQVMKSPGLQPAAWSNGGYAINSASGTNFSATVPLTNAPGFYRLQR